MDETSERTIPPRRWVNRTVLGIGAASFFSDVAHETATALLPILAGSTAAPAAILGAVEGISDAASGAAKLVAGVWTDRLSRLKPLAVAGYLVSAVAGASLGAATNTWQIIAARTIAWTGRGARTPARGALLASAVPPAHFGKAFGLERGMDTLGAVVGPLLAAALIPFLPVQTLLWWTLLPGLAAAAAMAFLVRETPRAPAGRRRILESLNLLPTSFRRYLFAVTIFGFGDFAHSLLILKASQMLEPDMGKGALPAAMILYALHNMAGAILAFVFGAMGDRIGRRRALAIAYSLGPIVALLMMMPDPGTAQSRLTLLAVLFILAGAMRAGESALESAVAAELLPSGVRGTGFGLLAALNSAGDLVASLMVGWLWYAAGPVIAFTAAIVPMTAGAFLMMMAARTGRGAAPRSD